MLGCDLLGQDTLVNLVGALDADIVVKIVGAKIAAENSKKVLLPPAVTGLCLRPAPECHPGPRRPRAALWHSEKPRPCLPRLAAEAAPRLLPSRR